MQKKIEMACAKLDNDRVEELEEKVEEKNVERSIHEMPPKSVLISMRYLYLNMPVSHNDGNRIHDCCHRNQLIKLFFAQKLQQQQ